VLVHVLDEVLPDLLLACGQLGLGGQHVVSSRGRFMDERMFVVKGRPPSGRTSSGLRKRALEGPFACAGEDLNLHGLSGH
jgi:hypothetical protein